MAPLAEAYDPGAHGKHAATWPVTATNVPGAQALHVTVDASRKLPGRHGAQEMPGAQGEMGESGWEWVGVGGSGWEWVGEGGWERVGGRGGEVGGRGERGEGRGEEVGEGGKER